MLDAPCLACLSLSVAPWNVSSGQERDLWFHESVSLIKVLCTNLSQNLLNVVFLCASSHEETHCSDLSYDETAVICHISASVSQRHFAISASLKSHLLCLYGSLIAFTRHWYRLIQIIFSPWIANNRFDLDFWPIVETDKFIWLLIWGWAPLQGQQLLRRTYVSLRHTFSKETLFYFKE